MPGHQRRARRCAAGLDQILREAQTLAGELVDARRRRAAQLAAAVGPEVAVADVVGEDEHDVGLLSAAERLPTCSQSLQRKVKPAL